MKAIPTLTTYPKHDSHAATRQRPPNNIYHSNSKFFPLKNQIKRKIRFSMRMIFRYILNKVQSSQTNWMLWQNSFQFHAKTH